MVAEEALDLLVAAVGYLSPVEGSGLEDQESDLEDKWAELEEDQRLVTEESDL